MAQVSQRFHLSARSTALLEPAHPDLAAVVRKAIAITEVDFTVLEVARQMSRQRVLMANGASATLNSRHLLQVPIHNPEYGEVAHAVDLGAYVAGDVRWDWGLYFKLAEAMRSASQILSVPMTWGGVWDRRLDQISGSLRKAHFAYIERFRRNNPDDEEGPLLDGPHFQLDWDHYPVVRAAA